jgi:hypothetical protein
MAQWRKPRMRPFRPVRKDFVKDFSSRFPWVHTQGRVFHGEMSLRLGDALRTVAMCDA